MFLILMFASLTAYAQYDAIVQPYFSPKGGCTDAIVQSIDSATTTIYVQAYSFTSAPIADALIDASKRGVSVQIVLDKSNLKGSSKYAYVVSHCVPVWCDTKHAIAHNKIIIIDDAKVLTGSFNFSMAAENSNAENLLIVYSKEVAKVYIQNWQKHKEHSNKL
jgi:phosphatidylserine/phosphatidylglycerophosphate/cardiolipin synthase-like enzyme